MSKDDFNTKLDLLIGEFSAHLRGFPFTNIEIVQRTDIFCKLHVNSMMFEEKTILVWYDKATESVSWGLE